MIFLAAALLSLSNDNSTLAATWCKNKKNRVRPSFLDIHSLGTIDHKEHRQTYSFDHLVSAGEQRGRDGERKRPRSFEITS
jgi:hypothetical protein